MRMITLCAVFLAAFSMSAHADIVPVISLDPISPSGGDEVNAMSGGNDNFNPANLRYSVDRFTFGLSGTDVEAESFGFQVSGDIFSLGGNQVFDEQDLGLVPGFLGDDINASTLIATQNLFLSMSADSGFNSADIFLNLSLIHI